jgi:hypothetical protein
VTNISSRVGGVPAQPPSKPAQATAKSAQREVMSFMGVSSRFRSRSDRGLRPTNPALAKPRIARVGGTSCPTGANTNP